MSIAPAILEHYPKLIDSQREVIGHLDGPLLVIAGPGSGKTFSIVLRALNILLLDKAEPKEIVLCTFTEKAAFEMRDRLAAAARKVEYTGDLSEMTVSTIHGFCHRVLTQHRHRTDLGHNYETLDELTQLLFIHERFEEIVGPPDNDLFLTRWKTRWTAIEGARGYFDKILLHRLGDDPGDDRLVHEETDATFSCGVWLSRSKRYILIGSYQTLTTEFRYLDAADPEAPLRTFLPRRRGHEYDIDHYRGRFTIRTNDGAHNFRLMEAEGDPPALDAWRELIPHREDVLITGFELFRDYLVVSERRDGLTRLRVRSWEGSEHYVSFGDAAFAVSIGTNREPETTTLRFHYSSMTTPPSVYDYDMVTRARTLLKQEEVLGDFDPARYETERLLATAPDGVRVPISLVRRKRDRGPVREDADRGAAQDAGAAPLLLYGYGAYGISMEPTFRSSRLSLLDRGFTYAIAHVRGGEELGRRWYDDGKLRKKKNTFTDFIACAEHLVAEGHAVPERLFAMGGSAGGLLMGAVINLRPDLFHGVVAQVPFVDVVTTMLDESLPLTTGEYDEWGDPNQPGDYAYIRSYSPYDNMEPVVWPHLLVMTGLHDSQVQYWEPAKWVARRRAHRPEDGRRLLLKTNMDAGHGGASGRFRQYRETALQYAFLLDLAGLADRAPAVS